MHLIFDFDGTLVDSFSKAMEKFNLLAQQFNFRSLDINEIHRLRELTSKQLIKHLKIPLYKLPQVIRRARQYMHDEMLNLNPFFHIPEVLHKLHAAGFTLGILTSNSAENVEIWLKSHDIYQLFTFIHIESNFFGKKHILRRILKNYEIDKSKAYYIGDETRDVEAAKKSGIYSIAVTWGFNAEKTLLQYEPHFIARRPEDILDVFHLEID